MKPSKIQRLIEFKKFEKRKHQLILNNIEKKIKILEKDLLLAKEEYLQETNKRNEECLNSQFQKLPLLDDSIHIKKNNIMNILNYLNIEKMKREKNLLYLKNKEKEIKVFEKFDGKIIAKQEKNEKMKQNLLLDNLNIIKAGQKNE